MKRNAFENVKKGKQEISTWLEKLCRCVLIATFLTMSCLNQAMQAHASVLAPAIPPISLKPNPSLFSLAGLTFNPKQPFDLQFIAKGKQDEAAVLAKRMITYFLTGLTLPEEDLWVNLSPYEQNRIMSPFLRQTALGQVLLKQDLVLKETASALLHPDSLTGKSFWKEASQQSGGLKRVNLDDLHKIWIMPDEARVYVKGQTVMITKATLKVCLANDTYQDKSSTTSSQTMLLKKWILPKLNEEINHHPRFLQLRQVYHALILAKWYKSALKESLITRQYANHQKIYGLTVINQDEVNRIYEKYLKAFKKGAFNFIREEIHQGERVPYKYFSGGLNWAMIIHSDKNPPQIKNDFLGIDVHFNRAMISKINPDQKKLNLNLRDFDPKTSDIKAIINNALKDYPQAEISDIQLMTLDVGTHKKLRAWGLKTEKEDEYVMSTIQNALKQNPHAVRFTELDWGVEGEKVIELQLAGLNVSKNFSGANVMRFLIRTNGQQKSYLEWINSNSSIKQIFPILPVTRWNLPKQGVPAFAKEFRLLEDQVKFKGFYNPKSEATPHIIPQGPSELDSKKLIGVMFSGPAKDGLKRKVQLKKERIRKDAPKFIIFILVFILAFIGLHKSRVQEQNKDYQAPKQLIVTSSQLRDFMQAKETSNLTLNETKVSFDRIELIQMGEDKLSIEEIKSAPIDLIKRILDGLGAMYGVESYLDFHDVPYFDALAKRLAYILQNSPRDMLARYNAAEGLKMLINTPFPNMTALRAVADGAKKSPNPALRSQMIAWLDNSAGYLRKGPYKELSQDQKNILASFYVMLRSAPAEYFKKYANPFVSNFLVDDIKQPFFQKLNVPADAVAFYRNLALGEKSPTWMMLKSLKIDDKDDMLLRAWRHMVLEYMINYSIASPDVLKVMAADINDSSLPKEWRAELMTHFYQRLLLLNAKQIQLGDRFYQDYHDLWLKDILELKVQDKIHLEVSMRAYHQIVDRKVKLQEINKEEAQALLDIFIKMRLEEKTISDIEAIKRLLKKSLGNMAMNGGIDLAQINVDKDGDKTGFNLDPMVDDFDGLTAKIKNIFPLSGEYFSAKFAISE